VNADDKLTEIWVHLAQMNASLQLIASAYTEDDFELAKFVANQHALAEGIRMRAKRR
jgi:hypothetical protein